MAPYILFCHSVTSRSRREDERDGQTYQFVTRIDMEMDVKLGCFLEHGEYEGNLYGTKISSIHEVVNSGRTCILDVNPQVHKLKPFISFSFMQISESVPVFVFFLPHFTSCTPNCVEYTPICACKSIPVILLWPFSLFFFFF